jgi:hypothetical protein
MSLMGIDRVEDWDLRIKRQDAFWDCAVIDRACVNIKFQRPAPIYPFPEGHHSTMQECWMDVAWQAERAKATVENTVYMGDALPLALPNLGPDYFPALYGGDLIFEKTTSYIKPFLKDWETADSVKLSRKHPYWKKMDELYDAFLEVGKGRFYVGWPDLHPGADCLVGIRGPSEMAMDLYDEPDVIKQMIPQVTRDFLETYDYYYQKLSAAEQACTGWPGVVSSRKWHVPSCDFSYMIGPDQFNEFFLEGLREESEHFEASLHHLDGPGCLNHLDSLLGIEKLNAVQWVWGAGNGNASDWIAVFQKIQTAGKGLQIVEIEPKHIDVIIENLRPEGVWMNVVGVKTEEQGEHILKQVARWK